VLLYAPEGPDTGVGGTAPNRPDCRPTLSSRSVRPLLTDLPALQYSVPSMYSAERKLKESVCKSEMKWCYQSGVHMTVDTQHNWTNLTELDAFMGKSNEKRMRMD
jgi:hypothetical protein